MHDSIAPDAATMDDILDDVVTPATQEEIARIDEFVCVLVKYSGTLVDTMKRNISGWPPIHGMSEEEALEAIMIEIQKNIDSVVLSAGLSESRRLGAWARARPLVMDLILTWKHSRPSAATTEGVENPT